MKISIFGAGYVGVVVGACLAAMGHRIVVVDVVAEKIALLNGGVSPIVEPEIGALVALGVQSGLLRATHDADEAVRETDVSLICVGTPSALDGRASLVAVEAVASAIARALREKETPHTIVMRSTVPPGTAEDLMIPLIERESGKRHREGFVYYSNPEFLREGSSVDDFRAPPFTLIGVPPGDDAAAPRALYATIDAPVHTAPYRVVESVKYLSNAFHAVKAAFANEAGQILAAQGVDAREAFRLFQEDRVLNISPAYLRPGYAFGGSCLPKDLGALLAMARDKNVVAPLLSEILPSNQTIVDTALAAIFREGHRRVALFGLAFKPGTDDLRGSPNVTLAAELVRHGYDLRIYDRHVNAARLIGANKSAIDHALPGLKTLLADSVADAMAQRSLVVIGHIAPEDRAAMIAALRDHVVLDLTGMPDIERLPGITYRGLCW